MFVEAETLGTVWSQTVDLTVDLGRLLSPKGEVARPPIYVEAFGKGRLGF